VDRCPAADDSLSLDYGDVMRSTNVADSLDDEASGLLLPVNFVCKVHPLTPHVTYHIDSSFVVIADQLLVL